MKKSISTVVALILILSMIPLRVFASDLSDSENDELIALACDIFPEYAYKIQNPPSLDQLFSATSARSIDDGFKIVLRETRNVSDSRQITYQEYANGAYSLTSLTTAYTIVRESYSGSGYSQYIVDIQVLHSYCPGAMYVTGFNYTLLSSSYDQINSFGTTNTSTVDTSLTGSRQYESANGPAYAIYEAIYDPADVSEAMEHVLWLSRLTVLVGDNGCTVTTDCELISD